MKKVFSLLSNCLTTTISLALGLPFASSLCAFNDTDLHKLSSSWKFLTSIVQTLLCLVTMWEMRLTEDFKKWTALSSQISHQIKDSNRIYDLILVRTFDYYLVYYTIFNTSTLDLYSIFTCLISYFCFGIIFTWVYGRWGCWEWQDWIMAEARSTPCSCRSCRSGINIKLIYPFILSSRPHKSKNFQSMDIVPKSAAYILDWQVLHHKLLMIVLLLVEGSTSRCFGPEKDNWEPSYILTLTVPIFIQKITRVLNVQTL